MSPFYYLITNLDSLLRLLKKKETYLEVAMFLGFMLVISVLGILIILVTHILIGR